MAKIVTLGTGLNGYSASQVAENAMTLIQLIEMLEEMAEVVGDDAVVVVRGSGRGAVYEPVLDVDGPDDDDDDQEL